MGKEADLESVEVSVSFPAPTTHSFTGGGMTQIIRAGTLSIRTAEFAGWHSAELIFLTDKETGEQSTYEVNRNFHYPHSDDDQLIFPVMRRS